MPHLIIQTKTDNQSRNPEEFLWDNRTEATERADSTSKKTVTHILDNVVSATPATANTTNAENTPANMLRIDSETAPRNKHPTL